MCEVFALLTISSLLGALLGHVFRNRYSAGFLLGLFLPVIGWALVFLLKDQRPPPSNRPRSLHSAPRTSPAGEHFCIPCGQEALCSIELGRATWHCPQCGRTV